jgi:tetratricopeptide (TPR) repeat protein
MVQPLEAIGYFNRGMAYTETGDYKKAIEEFSESLRLNPAHIKTLLMRGNAYIGVGEKDKAKADLDEYLRRKREKKV